jgi:hypothetical protein
MSTLLALSLQALDERTHGVGSEVLERLSFFIEPVNNQTITLCFQESLPAEGPKPLLFPLLTDLIDSGLLIRTLPDRATRKPAYVVRAAVRSYLHSRGEARQVIPDFSLSSHTGETRGVTPGPPYRVAMFDHLFESLCREAQSQGAQPDGLQRRFALEPI